MSWIFQVWWAQFGEGTDWVFHLPANNLGSPFSFLLFSKGSLNCVSFQENSFSGQRFKSSRRTQRTLKWGLVFEGEIQTAVLVWHRRATSLHPSAPETSTLMFGHPHVFVRATALRWWSSHLLGQVWGDWEISSPDCCSFPCHSSQDFQLPMSHPSHKELQELAAAVTPLWIWHRLGTASSVQPQEQSTKANEVAHAMIFSVGICPQMMNRKTQLKWFGMLQHDWSVQPRGFLVTKQQNVLQMMP